MYVYLRTEPNLFTVGFYAPDGGFHTESDHESRVEAAARVHFLNGGKFDDMSERIARLEVQMSEVRARVGITEVDELYEQAAAGRC